MHAFRALLTPVLIGLAGVWLTSCGGKGSDESTSTAGTNPPAGTSSSTPAAGTPTTPIEPGPVVARVNGQEIHKREVDRVYDNLARQNVPPDSTVKGNTNEERLRATALKLMVDQEMIKQAAAKEGITAKPEDVETQLSQVKAQYGGDAAFAQLLATSGANLDDVRRDIGDNMVLREFFRRHVDTEVTPEGAKAFFDANPGLFDEVEAEHILILTREDMDDMARAQARAKAAEALSKIKGGMSFADAVAAYSEDETTKANGGSLGWFSRGQMVPPFEQAAFALQKGQVSGLVETQFGVHIIQVSDRRSAKEQSWDEIQDHVMRYQQAKKQTDGAQAAVESLRVNAEVVYP